MLEHIVARGSPAQREWALRTLTLSAQIRGQRQSYFGAAAWVAPAQAVGMERVVYDAHQGATLPGRRIRGEGDPPTGDRAADEAYEGAAATYDLYQSAYGRNSIDGRGLRMDSTV